MVEASQENMRIGVVLSGGRAVRMNGADKGAVLLPDGGRMIDHVLRRFEPQVDFVLISGPNNYATQWTATQDRKEGPQGPAAGVWAAANWLQENMRHATAFITVPVDAPFLPGDLVARLDVCKGAAVASVSGRIQPTFAKWRLSDLFRIMSQLDDPQPSLKSIVKAANAEVVDFDAPDSFINVNTPEELARLRSRLTGFE